MMNIKGLVQDLRQTLHTLGWVQHNVMTDKGVCLLGGIEVVARRAMTATGDVGAYRDVRELLSVAIADVLWPDNRIRALLVKQEIIMRWNDRDDCTFARVDALLAQLGAEPVPAVVEPEDELVGV